MNKLKLEIYGASHEKHIGMRLYNIPKGEKIDIAEIQSLMNLRKSTDNIWSTKRLEADELNFLSGIKDGVSTGEVIECQIENQNTKSSDYDELKYIPRPSHADYTASVKDKTGICPVGGGRFSGRMTAPFTAAGGICREILKKFDIKIGAYVFQIGNVKGKSYLSSEITFDDISNGLKNPIHALFNTAKMEEEIKKAKEDGDSIGGIIECIIYNLPAGIGDAMLSSLEGKISELLFSIPAVKGVEFGSGFLLASMKGSEANDPLRYENGKIITSSNHNGGINGGISNGMPITLRIAVKPTPSIMKEQNSVNLLKKENCTLKIQGRHDACIVPRAVAPTIAAVSIALLDEILKDKEIL